MNLSKLISKLREIQESHLMLNTFGEGDIYNYVDNGGEIVYPVMWVVVKPSTYTNKTMRYRLQFIFADLLIEDKSNRLQLQSDQLQVALDILAKLKIDQDFMFINLDGSANIDFFEERFDDFTAGVSMELDLIDPKPLDLCIAPIN